MLFLWPSFGRWTHLCRGWCWRSILHRCGNARCPVEVPNSRRQGKLQQHILAGNCRAYLHFGTMSGSYYVLDAAGGSVVKEIVCGEPIFGSPVVANGRVYFATLGSKVYALEPDGTICWIWDFVREVLAFTGNRWSGEDWCQFKKGRVTWQDQFCCSADIAVDGKMLVIPAGGSAVCLEDTGSAARLRGTASVPPYAGSEPPATFGLTVGQDGAIYRQWHRRDNTGRVEIIRLLDNKTQTDYVAGTQTEIDRPGLLSFCSVSVRGQDVYQSGPKRALVSADIRPARRRNTWAAIPPSPRPFFYVTAQYMAAWTAAFTLCRYPAMVPACAGTGLPLRKQGRGHLRPLLAKQSLHRLPSAMAGYISAVKMAIYTFWDQRAMRCCRQRIFNCTRYGVR